MQKYNFYEKPQCILLFLAQICYKFFFKFVIFTIYTLNFMQILEFDKNLFDELTIITLSTPVRSDLQSERIEYQHLQCETNTNFLHIVSNKSFLRYGSLCTATNLLKSGY